MGDVIIYARFSPRPNASECESIAWQRSECEKFANQKGLHIRQFVEDPDVSGADSVRPAMWSAISGLKKGDTLLVWKWDRLARDLLLQLQIERAVESRGASVLAIVGDAPGNDPQSKFMRHILGAVAELERAMISQRTKTAMLAYQKSGRRMSARTPYGWVADPADGRRLVEDESEQVIRAEILEASANGMRDAEIARSLNERGIRPRIAERWSRVTVRQIISRG